MNRRYECILEICGMGVKLLVGYSFQGKLYIIHALESTSAHLDRGQITDKEAMILSIKEVVNSASKSLELEIKDVNLVLPPINVKSLSEVGFTQTVSKDSIVSNFDVENAMMLIKKKVRFEGYHVVDIHPTAFIYDNSSSKFFEKGVYSNTLKVNADVTLMNEIFYNSFIEVVKAANLNVVSTVVSTISDIVLLSTYNIPQQFLFMDMGGTLTNLALTNQGQLVQSATLNFGSEDVTGHLMNTFKINYERATYLKKVYGFMENPKFHFKFEEGFGVKELTSALEKAMMPVVEFTKNFIEENHVEEFHPLLLTGGGADLNNIETYLSSHFLTKVIVYNPEFIGARNKSYTNCVACLKYLELYPKSNELRQEKNFTLTRVDAKVDVDEEL